MNCPFCERIAAQRCIHTSSPGIVRFEPLDPVVPGHMLFVPVTHVEGALGSSVWTGWAMSAAATYAGRGSARSQAEDFNLITSNGPSATQTIKHLHVHYVPRREGDGLPLPWTGQRL